MHSDIKKLTIVFAILCGAAIANAGNHGISTFGTPKYPENFTHFDYVNPDAPKGGEVILSSIGMFDNLNPYIIKGTSAPGSTLPHCQLMEISQDELGTYYAYAAQSVEISPNRDVVTFTLNAKAKFSDGTPVTADDVVFSFETIKKKGLPFFAQYYKDVNKVEAISPSQIRFTLKNGKNRELPVILGQIPILSKKYYSTNDFAKTTLQPPIGCGPYVISSVDPGKSISYKLVKNWWGTDIPSQKGRNNYDITYKLFRDQTVWFEAFKSGVYDFRAENISKNWYEGYDFSAVKNGLVKMESKPNQLPATIQFFGFNTRKSIFKDPKVRQALGYAFDFEWLNKSIFFGAYKRERSFFENSEMAAKGLPQGQELEVLEKYRGKIPEEVFTTEFNPPQTDGTGDNRQNIKLADELLRKAGWSVKNGIRINDKTGERLSFEFLIYDPAYEKVTLAFQRGLKRLGIDMRIRLVTSAQYLEMVENHDFDMIMHSIGQSGLPGNEQRNYWASEKADMKGGMNHIGVKDPVVDELIEKIVDAETKEELVAYSRAFDRVLSWNYYIIPGWYLGSSRIAYWDKFGRPDKTPNDAVGFDTWWVDQAKANKLKSAK